MKGVRTNFDDKDDAFLVKYIAYYNPTKQGRLGNDLYKTLVENADDKWPWSKRHPWQSWRERYKTHEVKFDHEIRQYQKKKGIPTNTGEGDARTLTVDELVEGVLTLAEGRVKGRISEGARDTKKRSTAPSTSQESYTRKSAARKTPSNVQDDERRGALSGEEGTESSARGSDGEVEILGKEESVTKKRRASGPGMNGPGQAKRQKVREDVPPVLRAQDKAEGPRVSDEPVVTTKRKLDDTEMDDLPDSRGKSGESKLRVAVSATINDRTGRGSTPETPHTDEYKSVIKKIFSIVDASQRTRFLEVSGLSAEARAEILASIESATSGQEPSDSKATEPVENQTQASPEIAKDKEEPLKTATVLGAGDISGPAAISANSVTDAARSENTSSTTKEFLQDISPFHQPEIIPDSTTEDRTAPSFRHHSVPSQSDDDDYFATPSPPSAAQVSSGPLPSTSVAVTLKSTEKSNMDIRNPAFTKREPPRIVSNAFKGAYIHTNGRRTTSQRHAFDSGSDSDASDFNGEGTPVTTTSWPPRREKKAQRRIFSNASAAMEVDEVKIEPLILPAASMTEEGTKHAEKGASALSGAKVYKEKEAINGSSPIPQVPSREDHADHGPFSEAGPSKVPSSPANLGINVRKWRLDNPTPDILVSTSVGDLFSTGVLTGRLPRNGEKTRKDSALRETGENVNHRMTFGGFSTMSSDLPEVDLRKKSLLRKSLLGNPTLFNTRQSPSSSSSSSLNNDPTRSLNRRTSFVSTIDLTEEFPSPGVEIAPTDQVLVNRAGLQFFVQAMAQNHGVSEDWVRRVYEERRNLPGTDRILAEMRAAAERAFEKAIGQERQREAETSDSGRRSASRRTSEHLHASADARGSPDARVEGQMRAHEREINLSGVPQQSSGSRRRPELLLTPTSADEAIEHARAFYAPPSTSRAARYVRRMRRSSGVSSPLKPSAEVEEALESNMHDDNGGSSAAEEEEVSMSLPHPQTIEDTMISPERVHNAQGALATPLSATVVAASDGGLHHGPLDDAQHDVSGKTWTAEEDAVLLRGEENAVINTIVKKRGIGAVKRRIVELMADGGHES